MIIDVDQALQALNHPVPQVRWEALQFLDHHADAACVAAICAVLHDSVPRVRRMAVHALGCDRCKTCSLGVDIVPHVVERLLHDTNAKVRREAVWVLSTNHAGDARVRPILEQIAEQDYDSRTISWVKGVLRRQT